MVEIQIVIIKCFVRTQLCSDRLESHYVYIIGDFHFVF